MTHLAIAFINLKDAQPAIVLQKIAQSKIVVIKNAAFDVEGFEAFTRQYCDRFLMESRRLHLLCGDGDGLTTAVEQAGRALLPHAEGHYPPRNHPTPDFCFFYSPNEINKQSAGTILVDGTKIYQSLPLQIRNQFERHGIIYEMRWSPARWKAFFTVQTQDQLCTKLKKLSNVRYDILPNGELHLWHQTSTINTLANGEKAFINGLLSHMPSIPDHHPYNNSNTYHSGDNKIYFGNGETIPEQVIKLLMETYSKHMQIYQWHAGDLLILDNLKFMHGREISLTDNSERLIYTRFGWRSH